MAQIGPQYFPRPTGLLFQSKPLAPPALSHEEVLNKSGDADRRLTSSACIFVNQPGFACTGEFGGAVGPPATRNDMVAMRAAAALEVRKPGGRRGHSISTLRR
jgi:hypothetical protein